MTKKTGASLDRANSKQTWRTPLDLLYAVEARFGKIAFDLAAHSRNCVVPNFFSKREDSLHQDWTKLRGLLWLNPPFDDVRPWVKKVSLSAGREKPIAFLTRASVDSEWFYKHVHGKAFVMPLRGRVTFVGAPDPYPAGLMLSYFDGGQTVGFEPWRWKSELSGALTEKAA